VPAEDAHRDAFWVITVVGGMSIVKAIEDTIPDLSFTHFTAEIGFVLLRLAVFLITAVRFFIGASVFFQTVHIETGHETNYPNRNYVVDFASALIHFSILYVMALSIKVIPSALSLLQEKFFLTVCAVFLYDWIWYVVSTSYSTANDIKKWAIANSIILAPCILLFLAFRFNGIDRPWYELSVTFAILLLSVPDLIRMTRGTMPTVK
jgi:hypothetical protein